MQKTSFLALLGKKFPEKFSGLSVKGGGGGNYNLSVAITGFGAKFSGNDGGQGWRLTIFGSLTDDDDKSLLEERI